MDIGMSDSLIGTKRLYSATTEIQKSPQKLAVKSVGEQEETKVQNADESNIKRFKNTTATNNNIKNNSSKINDQ